MYKKIIIWIIVATVLVTTIYLCTYEKNTNKNKQAENNIDKGKSSFSTNSMINNEIQNEDETILGKIIINKINVNGIVKNGSDKDVLKIYIGHIESTAMYDGNVGLAAHNRGNQYSYFAKIDELQNGDEIIYQTKFGERIYQVNIKKIILETDWSMLQNTNDNRLTLVTCIKDKPEKRLCIQAIEKKG